MKKICFIVSSPYTAIAFLKSTITALSKSFDVYLIANLNSHENELLSKLEVKEIFHFNIVRKISLFEDSMIFCIPFITLGSYSLVKE